MAGAEGSSRAGPTGIHLVGAADLGVEPKDYPEALERLLEANPSARADLLQATRAEDHHAGLPPLSRLVVHAGIAHVWLVATRHDPPGPDDTLPLAEVIQEVVRSGGYDQGLTCELIEVPDVFLGSAREAIRDRIGRSPPDGALVIGIGGGPVETHLGIVLGFLEAGLVPRLCRTQGEEGPSFDLLVDRDLGKWLVRVGAFGALAALDGGRATAWRALDALWRLDWPAFRQARSKQAAVKNLKRRLPRGDPEDRGGWAAYRAVLASVILRRVGSGELDGLFLGRPWTEARCHEVAMGLDASEQARLRDHVAGAMRENGAWLPNDPPWHRLEFGPLIRRASSSPTTLRSLPTAVSDLLGDEGFRKVWEVSAQLDHGGRPEERRALGAARYIEATREGDDPLEAVLARLGYPTHPLLPGEGRLVVECTGLRDLADDGSTPMLDAVVAGLQGRGIAVGASHLRLVVTDENRQQAEQVCSTARSRGFASVEVIGPVPVADYPGCYELIHRALSGDQRIQAVGAAVVAVNPGSKEMNDAALVATVRWAFDACRPVYVAPLRRNRGGAPPTILALEETPEGRIAARFAHDEAVGRVLEVALQDLDFGLAKRMLAMASPLWTELEEDLGRLERLALHPNVRRDDLEVVDPGPATSARLWPARVALFQTIVERDPWRAIYSVAAIAEATWRNGRWRRDKFPVCRRIWRWRNESPLGHRLWAAPPDRNDVHRALGEAIGELEKGLPIRNPVPRCALVDLRARLLQRVRELAPRPVQGPAPAPPTGRSGRSHHRRGPGSRSSSPVGSPAAIRGVRRQA